MLCMVKKATLDSGLASVAGNHTKHGGDGAPDQGSGSPFRMSDHAPPQVPMGNGVTGERLADLNWCGMEKRPQELI